MKKKIVGNKIKTVEGYSVFKGTEKKMLKLTKVYHIIFLEKYLEAIL